MSAVSVLVAPAAAAVGQHMVAAAATWRFGGAFSRWRLCLLLVQHQQEEEEV